MIRHPIIKNDMERIYRGSTFWKELNDCTVLLTGANGMLGSYMLFLLLYLWMEQGISLHIIAVVRSESRLHSRLEQFSAQPAEFYSCLTVYESDLSEPLKCKEDIDYIIHAASLASPQFYGVCPVDVLLPNVISNYYLLQLARDKKAKGYLFFSTGDIYGVVDPSRLKADERGRYMTESDYGTMDPLDIHNCYSESKRMAETECYAFYRQYNVPVKIARIWHTYAPTMDVMQDPRVFASFVKNIVKKEDIRIHSDGSGKRSFCYITDAIGGYFTVLLKGKSGEAYNVCNSDQFVSIRELAEKLVALHPEAGLKVVYESRRPGEEYVENSVANSVRPDNTKLMQLGWRPETDIETGFGRVTEYISESMEM